MSGRNKSHWNLAAGLFLILSLVLVVGGCRQEAPGITPEAKQPPAAAAKAEAAPPISVVPAATDPGPDTAGKTAPEPIAAPAEPVAAQVMVAAVGDGKTFFKMDMAIQDGDTVFAVTERAAAQSGVGLKSQGKGMIAYISGIGGLMEFDRGPLSGWLYQVNGEYPGTGCGVYKLKAGDQVKWVYTLDGKNP